MAATFETLRVLKSTEEIADALWKHVVRWDDFAKDVVGKQLARAADSVRANIAEAFGHYHFGEKLQFLYYARGSIFETKYWLNRARARELLTEPETRQYVRDVTALARQLNAFADSLKVVRANEQKPPRTLREVAAEYWVEVPADFPELRLFDNDSLAWLES